jgi:hypothetical protein
MSLATPKAPTIIEPALAFTDNAVTEIPLPEFELDASIGLAGFAPV